MRDDGGRERVDNNIELVRGMIEDLLRGWEMPGREVEGVGDGFLDGEFFWGGGRRGLRVMMMLILLRTRARTGQKPQKDGYMSYLCESLS